jgi:gamma-glutamyl-gamma-aminobutyrate hydrolase PuuD
MKTSLVLGYSPFGNGESIYPFDELFDKGVNLLLEDSLKDIDALLLWGGADISPSLYGEIPAGAYTGPKEPSARDLFEWHLLREATQKGLPIIGVCRGAQLACAFAGGKLVQDCWGHHQSHQIKTFDGKEYSSTSSHHQMMYPYDIKHDLLAWSKETKNTTYKGLTAAETEKMTKEPEIVYFSEINAFAIQGHPEWQHKNDLVNGWILEQIVDWCFKSVDIEA